MADEIDLDILERIESMNSVGNIKQDIKYLYLKCAA